MRLFQNSALYPGYLPRLSTIRQQARAKTFAERMDVFLDDRFGAPHFLSPVLERAEHAFIVNNNDAETQCIWAKENGMSADASPQEILLAQIEHHRSEVFYNHDPVRYGDAFLARLPGCVRRTVAWRAAPGSQDSFLGHDLIVNNFPTLLAEYRLKGARAEYFFPAYDPVMQRFNRSALDRNTDLFFSGGYSRHHMRRAELLKRVSVLAANYSVELALDVSRYTRLAETPIGKWGPLSQYRRPRSIRRLSKSPVFGLSLYTAIGMSRLCLNGAVDMAGDDRGNMRCWEALGCGSLLVSDQGNYPDGFVDGETFVAYRDHNEALQKIQTLLDDPRQIDRIANAGRQMVESLYSKSHQFAAFERLVG